MKTKLRGIFQRPQSASVMGYCIAEPLRPTLLAVFWALVYLGLPVLLVGMLMVQRFTGYCIGLWFELQKCADAQGAVLGAHGAII